MNRLTKKALRFGMMLSPEVIAVHLSAMEGIEADQEAETLKVRWGEDVEQPARAAGLAPPRLVLLQSPYPVLRIGVDGLVVDRSEAVRFRPLREGCGRKNLVYPRDRELSREIRDLPRNSGT